MRTVLTDRRKAGFADRVAALDWQQTISDLDNYGCAAIKGLLVPGECHELSSCYDHDKHFRSRIIMARHGFGRGEYKYWAYPLPETIETLRTALYPHLAEVANRWNQKRRPRMQSRAEVVRPGQGDGVIFAVHHRPVQGSRGTYRVNLRHGVSRIRSGRRHTLGIIFHEAK